MRSSSRRWTPAVLSVVLGLLVAPACATDEAEAESPIDARLEHHRVELGRATPAGLAYVQAVAEAHDQADRASSEDDALAILRAAVERTPPSGDGAAELLHYELLARTAELALARGDSEAALALLEPRLDSARSLPVDRASARCLVALGDAANHTGDLALAMGSYARALDMLALLLEEAES